MKIPPDAIKLVVYDFDGVMTDNRVMVDQYGNESVLVNRSDGLAVHEIARLGIPQLIVSTEGNAVVSVRAEKIGIPVIQEVEDKKSVVVAHLDSTGIDPSRVVYVGNDINDRAVMEYVGWPICPADARPEIKDVSKVVLLTPGGHGVVRELLDHFLGAHG